MKALKPKAKDDVLYWDDNGRVTCGKCAGTTLRYTLRTLSGHGAPRVTIADRASLKKLGHTAKCECCNKEGVL